VSGSAGPGRLVHTSVHALERDIRAWIDTWNANPRAFTWTKTADEILASLADYLHKIRRPGPDQGVDQPVHFRRRTLVVLC
jgi:hypothetical protein